MSNSVILVGVLVASVGAQIITMTSESDKYLQERAILLNREKSQFFGHDISSNLNDKENKVNQVLLKEKWAELSSAYTNSSKFLPLLHFSQAKQQIEESPVFKIIKKVPKGASLHTHMLAAVSVDYIIDNFTYRDHLYGGYVNGVFKLKFMGNDSQNWTSIREMRLLQGAEVFDAWLRNLLTLNHEESAETVWAKFKKIFSTTYDFFSYKPVFQEYVQRLLQELYDDNVLYTELKGTIMILYDLDGTVYSNKQFFEIFIEEVEKFKAQHSGFKGAKYIHSIYRGVDFQVLRDSLAEIAELRRLFPNFIAGFDFVGYEEDGKTLFDYHSLLSAAQPDLKFFFHAGETPWFGHTDLNLADALLLNATRIGHGFAITKHPQLLELGKKRDIPLEICPISNQVLMLNRDPRTHPGAVLMSIDYPVVVGNDDPSVWNATGLTYDWYVVFMAMVPKNGGIEILKQLALNSIKYSAMEEAEKKDALEEWERQWRRFLEENVDI